MIANIYTAVRLFIIREDGAYAIEFGITFPVLMLLSIGLLEFSLVAFDYQLLAEATRRGVRKTIIDDPIPNTASLLLGTTITCTSSGGVVSCAGATPSVDADARFQSLLAEMRKAYPSLDEENITLIYEGTDVGDAADAGGVLPLVTLKLNNVRHDMIVGPLIGIPYINMPAFTTTILGPGDLVNTV